MASPVEARELGSEHGVQIRVGEAAEGGVARIEGDVLQVVESREQAHLGELADAGEEGEANVRVLVLDDRVDAVQKVAVCPGDLRRIQRVQDRLVVLVDQHRHRLSGAPVQGFQQQCETSGSCVVLGTRQSRMPFGGGELFHEVGFQMTGLLEVAGSEAQAQHRMAHRPIPVLVDVEALEEPLVAFEQLLQRIQEQALAEAPRAGEEVVSTGVQQSPDVGGLVDVVAVVLPDLAEGLNADR